MSGGVHLEAAKTKRSDWRGSWERALQRLRVVLRRRHTTCRDTSAEESSDEGKSVCAVVRSPRTTAASTGQPTSKDTCAKSASVKQARHLESEGLNVGEDDSEPLLPLTPRLSIMDSEKAKALFAKHGLSLGTKRGPDGEPPSKLRRVEKPIRVRLHYRCHECQGQFGQDRHCRKCSHRRCGECTRQPGTGVRELMASGRQAMAQEETRASSSIAAWATNVTGGPDVPPSEVATVSSNPLENDDAVDGEMNPLQGYSLYIDARPRDGHELIRRANMQPTRRSCHECETPFLPADKTTCDKCSHTRCSLCPRWPKEDSLLDTLPDSVKPPKPEVRMVAAVQRVFRKPRQRVRYTCDQCQATFVDRHTCQSCGHEKCAGCSRNPRKKPAVADPATLQAVADRLFACQTMPSPSAAVSPIAG